MLNFIIPQADGPQARELDRAEMLLGKASEGEAVRMYREPEVTPPRGISA